MNIIERIKDAQHLTTVDQRIANTVISLMDNIESYSIKDLAAASYTSTASISRFCNKLGIKGYKYLKSELIRFNAMPQISSNINIDFPFQPDDTPRTISHGMDALYQIAIQDALQGIDYPTLVQVAKMLSQAERIDFYTHSHNLYPVLTFQDRLLRIGISAHAPSSDEQQRLLACSSHKGCVALAISYSGRATFLPRVLNFLQQKKVPTVFIGSYKGCILHPGLTKYLSLNSREHPQERISQFATHIALQYILDVLYGCIFTIDYSRNIDYINKENLLVDDRIFPESSL